MRLFWLRHTEYCMREVKVTMTKCVYNTVLVQYVQYMELAVLDSATRDTAVITRSIKGYINGGKLYDFTALVICILYRSGPVHSA